MSGSGGASAGRSGASTGAAGHVLAGAGGQTGAAAGSSPGGEAGTSAHGGAAGADPCVHGTSRICVAKGCSTECTDSPGDICAPTFDETQGIVTDIGFCTGVEEDELPGDCLGCRRDACMVFSDTIEFPDYRAANCIDSGVCDLMIELGHPDSCRYTDRSKYDGPLEPPTSCVPTQHAKLCAGACGACSPGTHCSYRSKERPLGVCVPDKRFRCGITDACVHADDRCLVFPQAPGVWHESAIRNGICLPLDQCVELGQVLPGGAVCFHTTESGVTVLSGSFDHP